MTTLYRPVRIETAEQADALPVGTIARHASGPGMDHAHKVSPIGRDVWVAIEGNSTNASMVGWIALVPIEAEEETTARMEHSGVVANLGGSVTDHEKPSRRLVTPWEEA